MLHNAFRTRFNTSACSWARAYTTHVTNLTQLQWTWRCGRINTSLSVSSFKCVTKNSSHIVFIHPFTVIRFSTGHSNRLALRFKCWNSGWEVVTERVLFFLLKRHRVCFMDSNISFYFCVLLCSFLVFLFYKLANFLTRVFWYISVFLFK